MMTSKRIAQANRIGVGLKNSPLKLLSLMAVPHLQARLI